VFPARRNLAPDWLDVIEQPATGKRQAGDRSDLPRPVAPFYADPSPAVANCFDRLTGAPVTVDQLKSYANALSDYHLHPEAKFLNRDYLDRGPDNPDNRRYCLCHERRSGKGSRQRMRRLRRQTVQGDGIPPARRTLYRPEPRLI
jgi:hypothetical protein